jgi:hypothetical protein
VKYKNPAAIVVKPDIALLRKLADNKLFSEIMMVEAVFQVLHLYHNIQSSSENLGIS